MNVLYKLIMSKRHIWWIDIGFDDGGGAGNQIETITVNGRVYFQHFLCLLVCVWLVCLEDVLSSLVEGISWSCGISWYQCS
jgi:hypothetical protein